ncbi:MAG: 3-isopropylmalate dehydrogenase [Acidimicrobiia bacterium]|nr:3-isopropylmalate dehydrogenase [Acidimicrobiia bacterium]
MSLKIALMPGDGIGPEVTDEAVRILTNVAEHAGRSFTFSTHAIGGAAIDTAGRGLPERTLEAALNADAVLLGAVGHPKFDGQKTAERPEAALLALRQALGGFANLRPAVCYPPLARRTAFQPERVKGASVLIVRELLGGLYFGEPRGFEASGNTAFNTLIYSRHEIERVAKVGFERARERRKKVASIDKANVLETSRLWRAVVSDVAKGYPDVELEHVYVDTAAMRLATAPASFDVMLCDNLFGDILSDQAASIAGSLGLLPSATVGGKVDLYEPVHGSAPDIAGKGLANPIGAIASAAMLLRFSARMDKEAGDIDHAIEDALAAGARTRDLAGPGERVLSTREMGQAIEEALNEVRDRKHCYHGV